MYPYRVNPMFKSILTVLLFAYPLPSLADGTRGSWYNGTYYPHSDDAALCASVAQELQDGIEEGLFTEDYAEYVLEGCLRWANA